MACTECPAGRANTDSSAARNTIDACHICGKNEIQPAAGGTSCEACPSGFSINDEGTDPDRHDSDNECTHDGSAPINGGSGSQSADAGGGINGGLVEDNNDGNPVLWLGLGLSALLMGTSALFCKRYRDNSERHKKASLALTERFVLEEEAKWVEQKQILLADQTLVERRALFGWIIQREELTFEKVIGRGAFGEVFRGTWRGQPCAIKNIFERDQNQRYSNPQRPVQRRQVQAGSPSSSSSSFAFSNTPFDTNPDYLAIRMDGSEYATMSKKEQSDIFTMQLSSSTGMGAMAARMLSNMELSVLMKLRHPRIVALLGAGEFVENDRVGVFLVMELVVGSDLRK